jgi:hypothetical protein
MRARRWDPATPRRRISTKAEEDRRVCRDPTAAVTARALPGETAGGRGKGGDGMRGLGGGVGVAPRVASVWRHMTVFLQLMHLMGLFILRISYFL